MSRVFLSYSQEDLEFARRLNALFVRDGVDCFFDRDSIPPGADWVETLERAIEEADVLVLVATPSYLKSPWTKAERNAAMAASRLGKMLIPLRLKDCKLPAFLSHIQSLDFRPGADFDDAYRRLCSRLGVRIESQTSKPLTSLHSSSDRPASMGKIPVVFVSSTVEDLGPFREKARDAALAVGFLPRMMEYFPASGNPPLEECLARISGSKIGPAAHLLIAIVAHRYGWVPEGQADGEYRSITWLECLEAESNGLEVLAFLSDEKAEWPESHRERHRLAMAAEKGTATPELIESVQKNIASLKEFKTWLLKDRVCASFTTAEDLHGKVLAALHEWRKHNPNLVDVNASNRHLAVGSDQKSRIDTIREQCRILSESLATETLHLLPVQVTRSQIRSRFQHFLDSPERHLSIVGPAGVGKSVAMKLAVSQAQEQGWDVLLQRGSTFKANAALTHPEVLSISVLARLVGSSEDSQGLLLLIDGVDEADSRVIARELQAVHDQAIPLDGAIKIVISCQSLSWTNLRDLIPFFRSAPSQTGDVLDQERRSGRRVEYTVKAFSDEELDEGLNKLEATEFLSVRARSDSHVASVRDILKHPSCFGFFVELRQSKPDLDLPSILTWSWLVQEAVESDLRRISSGCRINRTTLRSCLMGLAESGWNESPAEIRYPMERIEQKLPFLQAESTDPHRSPFAALLDRGILIESDDFVRFRQTDVGHYFLSLAMERRAEGLFGQEIEALIEEWGKKLQDSPPLVDALAAWVDRQVDGSSNTLIDKIIELLAQQWRYQVGSLFRQIRTTAVGAIFRSIAALPDEREKGTTERLYRLREAAQGLRPSLKSIRLIEDHLEHENAEIQRLAIDLLGQYKNADSVPQLVSLLKTSPSDHLRTAVGSAIQRFGKDAIDYLVRSVADADEPDTFRKLSLRLLASIGYRTSQVIEVLDQCSKEPSDLEITPLVVESVRVAQVLKDRRQKNTALRLLKAEDASAVGAAADYFASVPSTDVADPLAVALEREYEQWWVAPQLLKALAKVNPSRADELAVGKYRHLASREWGIHLRGVRALIFEEQIHTILKSDSSQWQFHEFSDLCRAWEPQDLRLFARLTRKLSGQKIDLSKRIARFALDQMESEHGGQLEHTNIRNLLAKCQAPGTVESLGRVLVKIHWHVAHPIADSLWIAADSPAEKYLLDKLAQPADGSLVSPARTAILRALGTCGTEKCVPAFLEALRNDDELFYGIEDGGICPLVNRGILSTSDLVALCKDNSASSVGRTLCLIALGILNAKEHSATFRDLASLSEDSSVRGYAVRLLGFSRDAESASHIQGLLEASGLDAFSSKQAAFALKLLDARESVPVLEKNFLRQDLAQDQFEFIDALAHFASPSSLPVLLEALEPSSSLILPSHIIEALGAYLDKPEARRRLEQALDSWADNQFSDSDQVAAIRAFARAKPQELFAIVENLAQQNRLAPGSRQVLALRLPFLVEHQEADDAEVYRLMTRLAADPSFTVREAVGLSLIAFKPAVRIRLFQDLSDSQEEWQEACAFQTLSYWDSSIELIDEGCFHPSKLVRRFADRARNRLEKHRKLGQLVHDFTSGSSLRRLAAYLAIEEQGIQQTIRLLQESTRENSIERVFVSVLSKRIKNRIRSEADKEAKSEQDFLRKSGFL